MDDYRERIDSLAADARAARSSFEPPGPDDPPAVERAREFVSTGLGPTIMVYVHARAGDQVRFEDSEFERLERTMNDWLELYAACYGVDIDAAFTIREAAEALIDTHDARAVARVLTGLPPR